MERIALCTWRLRRLGRIEVGILTGELLTLKTDFAPDKTTQNKTTEDKTISDERAQHNYLRACLTKTDNVSLLYGAAFKQDAENAGAISKLSRYEVALERSLYRALHELQRIQAARENGQQPASVAVDVTVDGPGLAPNSDD